MTDIKKERGREKSGNKIAAWKKRPIICHKRIYLKSNLGSLVKEMLRKEWNPNVMQEREVIKKVQDIWEDKNKVNQI